MTPLRDLLRYVKSVLFGNLQNCDRVALLRAAALSYPAFRGKRNAGLAVLDFAALIQATTLRGFGQNEPNKTRASLFLSGIGGLFRHCYSLFPGSRLFQFRLVVQRHRLPAIVNFLLRFFLIVFPGLPRRRSPRFAQSEMPEGRPRISLRSSGLQGRLREKQKMNIMQP